MRTARVILLIGILSAYLLPWYICRSAPISGLRVVVAMAERAARQWKSEGDEILEGERVRSGHLDWPKAVVTAARAYVILAPLVFGTVLILRAVLPGRRAAPEPTWTAWALAVCAMAALLASGSSAAAQPVLYGPLATLAAALGLAFLCSAEKRPVGGESLS